MYETLLTTKYFKVKKTEGDLGIRSSVEGALAPDTRRRQQAQMAEK